MATIIRLESNPRCRPARSEVSGISLETARQRLAEFIESFKAGGYEMTIGPDWATAQKPGVLISYVVTEFGPDSLECVRHNGDPNWYMIKRGMPARESEADWPSDIDDGDTDLVEWYSEDF